MIFVSSYKDSIFRDFKHCAGHTKNDFFIPKRILKVYLFSLSVLFGTFQIPFIVWPKFGLRCVTWLKNESVSSYFGQKEYSELKVICQCWKERNKRSFASLLHSLLQRSWKSRFIATVAKKRSQKKKSFHSRFFFVCSTTAVQISFILHFFSF